MINDIQSPPTRRSNKLFVWLWRGLLGMLALIVILALAGAVYQAIATAIDQRNYKDNCYEDTWS